MCVYIYIYIYVYACVCTIKLIQMCVCMFVCFCQRPIGLRLIWYETCGLRQTVFLIGNELCVSVSMYIYLYIYTHVYHIHIYLLYRSYMIYMFLPIGPLCGWPCHPAADGPVWTDRPLCMRMPHACPPCDKGSGHRGSRGRRLLGLVGRTGRLV